MTDIEKLALPSSTDGLKQLLAIAVEKGYEAAILDVTDAALKRDPEDCATFLRALRNDADFAQDFIHYCRRRREGR
jgi:hypothetical protein